MSNSNDKPLCDNLLSCLSQHIYVAQTGLTRRLAVDLLDKMNNPENHQHYTEVDDDDLEVTPGSVTYTFISLTRTALRK